MARFTASSSERLGRVGAGVTRVYLDYASFSPVDPRVVALMRPFLEGGVGNPGAPHSLGLEARASLDGARAKVARLVGATAAGVIFTASATEANNLAIRGLAARARGRHVVTTAIEHISVLNACRYLAKRGWEVAYLPVDGEGRGGQAQPRRRRRRAGGRLPRGDGKPAGDRRHGRGRRPRARRGRRREPAPVGAA